MSVDPFLESLKGTAARSRARQNQANPIEMVMNLLAQKQMAEQQQQAQQVPLLQQPPVGALNAPQGPQQQGRDVIQGGGTNFGTHQALGEFIKASGLQFNSADHGIGSHSKFVHGTNKISQHTLGNALDISGTPEQLRAMVGYLQQNADKLHEIIYSPTGTFLSRGKSFNASAITKADHQTHIHVSADPDMVALLKSGGVKALLKAVGK